MNYSTVWFCAFLLYFLMSNNHCLHIIPERAAIIYYNKSYFEDDVSYNVRRYKRKGDYYVNAFFRNKVVLSNTITMDVIFHQYLHNEFRRSFPEMHFNVCDLFNNDPYLGKSVRLSGLTNCPIQPGKHYLRNMSFNQRIPSVWPYEKGMVEFIGKDTKRNDVLLGKIQLVVTFKQDLPRHKT